MRIPFNWIRKAWISALVCSAIVLIVAPQAVAQNSKETMLQQLAKWQALMSEGSQKIMDASKSFQEAMKLMQEEKSSPKAKQLVSQANKTMLEGETLVNKAHRIDDMLLQTMRANWATEKKMMKGARLMQKGMLMVMKDEEALSKAQRTVTQGNALLKQVEPTISAQLK